MTTLGRISAEHIAPEQGRKKSVLPVLTATAIITTVIGAILGLGVALSEGTYDVWVAFIVAPVALCAVIPVALWVARHDGDEHAKRFFVLAAVLKVCGGSLARYFMAYGLYDEGDSERYFVNGGRLTGQLASLDFSGLGELSGTRSVEVFAGGVQVFTGPTRLGGFIVFSSIALLGALLFHRAIQIAYPASDLRRFRVLLFLYPTMVFWPSSIGKDALVMGCIGAITYGMVGLLHGRFATAPVGVIGLWGAAVIRPHIALLVLLGVGAAVILSGFKSVGTVGSTGGASRLIASVLAIGITIVAAGGAVGAFQSKFAIDDVNQESTNELFDEVNRRTSKSGSTFDSPSLSSPLGVPQTVATVLYRPFPFESGSAQELVSSFEGVMLLVIMLLSWRQLRRVPGAMFREPVIAAAVVYTTGFIVAFVNVENFGILARQRAQVLPFLFVLVAVGSSARTQDEPVDDESSSGRTDVTSAFVPRHRVKLPSRASVRSVRNV